MRISPLFYERIASHLLIVDTRHAVYISSVYSENGVFDLSLNDC